MSSDTPPVTVSKGAFWTGWVLSVLPVLLLLMSAGMKLANSEQVQTGFREFGYPDGVALVIGIVELACVIIYLIPQTAVLGAILLTGYLGGAVATHVRAGQPFFMPILVGVVLWLGLVPA